MTNNQNNIVMFISETGHQVYKNNFIELINKYNFKDVIKYYIEKFENLFEITTNTELIKIQNIVWNNALSIDLIKNGKKLYKLSLHKINDFNSNIINNDIIKKYKNLSNCYFDFKILNNSIELLINRFDEEYPIHTIGYNVHLFNLLYVNYEINNLINEIDNELILVKKQYNNYIKNILTKITLCFKYNFGLKYNLKIEEKSLVNNIIKFLF